MASEARQQTLRRVATDALINCDLAIDAALDQLESAKRPSGQFLLGDAVRELQAVKRRVALGKRNVAEIAITRAEKDEKNLELLERQAAARRRKRSATAASVS